MAKEKKPVSKMEQYRIESEKHEPKKKPPGRPRLKIDYGLVEKLAAIHCTQEEIASVLGCSRSTLLRNRRFCDTYKQYVDRGKISVRRMQWKSAEAGSVAMQIWLGKQLLGQRDLHHLEDDRADKSQLPTVVHIVAPTNDSNKD